MSSNDHFEESINEGLGRPFTHSEQINRLAEIERTLGEITMRQLLSIMEKEVDNMEWTEEVKQFIKDKLNSIK